MQPGTVLSHRYRLVSLLGRGGMGTVWRAEHLGLHAPVAIKLLGAGFEPNPEAVARFQREARSAANLRSPHVVQILDHGIDEASGSPFIAMELMEGESLSERLGRSARLTPLETVQVVSHVARALTRAHELGIVHRDLKPGNVFLVQNEDEPIAKVLDFGIAKWTTRGMEGANLTGTNTVMGTPYYMSPEQLTGARLTDHRTDLWALGVIAYECLTGTPPFSADNMMGIAIKIHAAEVPPVAAFGLPPAYDGFFARALARSPEARFQSARELSDELRRVVLGPDATAPAAAAPVTPATPPNDRAERGPSSRTVTAVAATPARAAQRSVAPWLVLVGLGLVGAGATTWLTLTGRDAESVTTAPSATSTAAPDAVPATAVEPAASPTSEPQPVTASAPAVAPSATSPSSAVRPTASAAPSASALPRTATTTTSTSSRRPTPRREPAAPPASDVFDSRR